MLNYQDKKNSIWFSFSFIINSILNFVIYSICFKSLDNEIFGLYIFLNSIFLIGNTLDFGFGLSTIKHISQARTKNEFEFIDSYFTTFFYSYLILAFIISFAFLLYYFLFLRFSDLLNNSLQVNNFLIFVILTFGFFVNYLTGFLKCIMEGFSDYVILSKLNITIILINFILVIPLYIFKLDIYYLAYITLIVNIFSFSIIFFYLFIKYKYIRINLNKYDFDLIKKHYKYGLKIHISMFIGSFTDPIIKYLIGTYLSLGFITYYESSKKIINFSNGLIFSAQRTLFVKLSQVSIKGTLKKFVNENLPYYSKMSNYYSIIFYGILNPLICFFIMLWFKSFESVMIFLIFIIPYTFINFAGSLYNVLMVEGKGLALIIIQSINIVCLYVLLYISLSLFNNYLGLYGFLISTLINIILIFYFLKKNNKLDYITFISQTKLYDIIKLNLLILLQTFLLFKYSNKINYILIITFVINSVIFWKYSKYILIKVTNLIRSRININK